MNTRFMHFGAVMAACLLIYSRSAHAIPTLTLSDRVTTVTVVDGGVGDLNPLPGVVSFAGAVGGNWLMLPVTGTTKPQIGSASFPGMNVNLVAASAGAGTLTVTWSDDFFGPSDGSVAAAIGGATAGSVSYATYVDPLNTLAPSDLLTSQGPLGSGAFSGAAEAALSLGAPYSLTMQMVITHATQGISSLDASLSVPDGGSTIGFLGSALLGLIGVRRITNKRKAIVNQDAFLGEPTSRRAMGKD